MHERFWADDLIYTASAGRRLGKADILREVREEGPPKPGGEAVVYTAGDSHPAIRRHRHRYLPSGGDDRESRSEKGHPLPEHRHVPETKREMADRQLAGDGGAESTHTNTAAEKERAAAANGPSAERVRSTPDRDNRL
jgi:hypothetical protein